MNKEQLEFFRERLNQEKAQLVAELERIDRDSYENAQDQSAEGLWGADVATDVYEETRILNERNEVLNHLREVDRALERIANGTYGISLVSGKPIPLERLEALPWATNLVEEIGKEKVTR